MDGRVVAVVLAGGGADRVARHAGVAVKALVPFGSRTLLEWVLAALRESRLVQDIVLVEAATSAHGSTDRTRVEGLVRISGGERLVDSLALGFGAAAALDAGSILVVTADLPWLTGATVDGFLAEAPRADVVYPAVRSDAMERRFPGQRRTYTRLREGRFTGGNAALVAPRAVASLLPVMDDAYRARKNPLALASLVGWNFGLRLLARTLTVADAERRVSRLLGCEARAMTGADPALAADIDRLEHLSLRPPAGTAADGDVP